MSGDGLPLSDLNYSQPTTRLHIFEDEPECSSPRSLNMPSDKLLHESSRNPSHRATSSTTLHDPSTTAVIADMSSWQSLNSNEYNLNASSSSQLHFPQGSEELVSMPVTQIHHLNNLCSDPDTIEHDLMTLNVGGKRFRLRAETVAKRDDTSKLAKWAKMPRPVRKQMMGHYAQSSDEHFFERPPDEAKLLAQYYMSGVVHKPAWMCFELFNSCLTYWEVPDTAVGECCRRPVRPAPIGGAAGDKNTKSPEPEYSQFDSVPFGDSRKNIWRLFEEPQSSALAKTISALSMAFIMASLSGLILSSMEEFQIDPPPPSLGNQTVKNSTGPRDPIPALAFMEFCCVMWFSFEFMVRFIVCVEKCKFLCTALNLIDAATVIPFYAETLLLLLGFNAESLKRVTGVMMVVRALRVLRVARLFKLARYSSALQIMGDTFRNSAQELSMLVMLLSTGIIFFATILYFLENDVGSGFSSIPASCWWCVVTMTTVGYGDVVPKTAAGKIVATVTSICGIIVLAFPISLIVEKFATAQEQMESSAASAAPVRNGAVAMTGGNCDMVAATPKVRKVFGGKFGGRRRKTETPMSASLSNY